MKRKRIRPPKFKIGARVTRTDTGLFFNGQSGTVVDVKVGRFQVLFDSITDPRHAYWFDEKELTDVHNSE